MKSEEQLVSFWSILLVFLFVIPTPSHACFCCSKASFDAEFDVECCRGLGWGRTWKIGSVSPFLVVWVRFVAFFFRLFDFFSRVSVPDSHLIR